MKDEGAVVSIPAGQTQGRTLIWDAGPAHRFAELWVSVDDASPAKLFGMNCTTQGKSSFIVTVQKGSRHRFILTDNDNGKELASLVVKYMAIDRQSEAQRAAGSK